MKKPLWLINYVWSVDDGSGDKQFTYEVTTKTPVELFIEWRDKFDGNNGSVILSAFEIPEPLQKKFKDEIS